MAKQDNLMALAEAALNHGDSQTLFNMFRQSQEDIVSLLRMQAVYTQMEGKAPQGDMDTVKTIAMEAMSLAKMIIQGKATP